MSEEEKRIKILEFLGWSDFTRHSKMGTFMALRGTSPDGKKEQLAPNPLKNHNLVLEALRKLTFHQQTDYSRLLMHIYTDYPMTNAFLASTEDCVNALLKTLETP